MRLGRFAAAVDLYRALLVEDDTVFLNLDRPTHFITNYATALLLEQNVAGCLSTLEELKQEENPMVRVLRGAIRQWRRELGWWGRLLLALSGVVRKPVSLDFPPGQVAPADSSSPTRAA